MPHVQAELSANQTRRNMRIAKAAPVMNPSNAAVKSSLSNLQWQLPSFIAVGLFGLFVDSTVTYIVVRSFEINPLLARFPAFALATVLNFWLNRFLTFRHSTAPLWRVFVKYVFVCVLGFCVNFVAYAAALWVAMAMGYTVPAAYLPIFVAWGGGCAMFVTFIGYRQFAFRK